MRRQGHGILRRPTLHLPSQKLHEPSRRSDGTVKTRRQTSFEKRKLFNTRQAVESEWQAVLTEADVLHAIESVYFASDVHETRSSRKCEVHLKHVADVLGGIAGRGESRPTKIRSVLYISNCCLVEITLRHPPSIRLKESGKVHSRIRFGWTAEDVVQIPRRERGVLNRLI